MEIPGTIYPAIATVTAALIGAGIAFLTTVLSKEQKTSEFRQAWINSVLEDIAKFIGAVESLSAAAWSHHVSGGPERSQAYLTSTEAEQRALLGTYYRARLRLNPTEHQVLLNAMEDLRTLLIKAEIVDRSKVDTLVRNIEQIGHAALKAEWVRVKRGERPFYVTKNISLGLALFAITVLLIFGIFLIVNAIPPFWR